MDGMMGSVEPAKIQFYIFKLTKWTQLVCNSRGRGVCFFLVRVH